MHAAVAAAEAHVCAVVYIKTLWLHWSMLSVVGPRLAGGISSAVGGNERLQGCENSGESGFGGQWCACWAVWLVSGL
jgi:hypothetical protein